MNLNSVLGCKTTAGGIVVWALLLAPMASAAQVNELLFSSTASGSMQLHAMVEGGKTVRMLTAAPGDNDNASWSGDGQRIAFVSTRDGRPQVYVMNADGSQQKRVSAALDHSHSPAWSPDSRSLAFAGFRGGKHGLYIHDLPTGIERLVAALESGATGLAWAPVGEKLAFAASTGTRRGNISIADLKTGSSISLPEVEGASLSRPVWAPDGSRLVYVSSAGRKGINIFSCKPDGSDVKAVTQTIYSSASPVWSPDGKAIAFTSNLETGERGEIFVANLASGELRNLTRHEHEDLDPAWAPDSRTVYFVSFRTGTSQIYKAALDGTTTRVSVGPHYESTPLPRPGFAASVATVQASDSQAQRPNRRE